MCYEQNDMVVEEEEKEEEDEGGGRRVPYSSSVEVKLGAS
jgi:hypothetical protein